MGNTTFQYEGAQQKSLQNVNFQILQGECLVLTGNSGCGKTTIMRLLNGLIPHFYKGDLEGGIHLGGREVKNCEPYELSTLVGSVFQNPRTQFFNTDSTGELVFGMENMGIPRDVMKQRLEDTVQVLNLEGLRNRDIFALSGGEKQRIAFGSVYGLLPEIYCLDEPTANLDLESIKRLREALLHVKAQGKTLVIAEHRLHYLEGIADRILLMKEGQIEKEWSGKNFYHLSNEELATYGLRPHKNISVGSETRAQTTATFEIKNLAVGYGGERIFEGFSLKASPGDIVGIVGSNGDGKTTLARTICGLHKEVQGEIYLHGKRLSFKQRSRHTYLVMQDPNYQLFADSVANELKLGNGKAINDEVIETILKQLSLEKLRDRHPLSLSGGQKQRLAIALAALSEGEILIFDEPTSGLDLRNMERVVNMLRMLATKGKIVLVITHDLELLNRGCHRMVRLSKNK